jgi:hypothetical protein
VANATATARPIPRDAPVTNTALLADLTYLTWGANTT